MKEHFEAEIINAAEKEAANEELRNAEAKLCAEETMTRELLLEVLPGISEEQIKQFVNYYNIIIERNRSVNLTRITAPREFAEKHFADSVLGAPFILEGAAVIDVGTGAGFPGIPLKIMRPDISLTLLDSLGKRVRILEEVCAEIGIEAKCIHARAEDAARNDSLRAHFDIALSRAVAPMNVLLELTVPFLKVGGSSLMYKSASAQEEALACENARTALFCGLEMHGLEASWGERVIVEAKKLAKTPAKYPRKAGAVQKSPL